MVGSSSSLATQLSNVASAPLLFLAEVRPSIETYEVLAGAAVNCQVSEPWVPVKLPPALPILVVAISADSSERLFYGDPHAGITHSSD